VLNVIGGSASTYLAYKISRVGQFPIIPIESKVFPDGERYVRVLGDVEGKRIALIQSMYRNPDSYLIEFIFISRTLKELGAKEVIGVIPYFPYARQDTRFNSGEAVSLDIVSRLIEESNVDKVITVDMHLHRYSSIKEVFRIPAENISAVDEIARYLANNYKLESPVIIGPDEESEQWAKRAASVLECDYDVLEKRRISAEEVEIVPRKVSVKGRDVVIVDDIISTGGTMAEAIKMLLKQGARRVIGACTHAILAGNALERIYRAGAHDVIATDTVPSPISVVSVAELLAKTLREHD